MANEEDDEDIVNDDEDEDGDLEASSDNIKPAWVDDDEEELRVNIADSNKGKQATMSRRVKKLQLSRDEVGANALTGNEYERRLRQRFEITTLLA